MGRDLLPASKRRREEGTSIVEFGAACALGIPLLITILYVTLESSYLFSIRANIDVAARNAARAIAIKCGSDNTYWNNDSKCRTDVLQKIKIPGYVASDTQFAAVGFASGPPKTVSVTCTYIPGAGAAPEGPLPPFPNPDPLHLGNSFRIRTTATFSVE